MKDQNLIEITQRRYQAALEFIRACDQAKELIFVAPAGGRLSETTLHRVRETCHRYDYLTARARVIA